MAKIVLRRPKPAEPQPGQPISSGNLYLIRHANTALNKPATGKELIRGHLDPPLDHSGQEQSKEIAHRVVTEIKPDQVASSDLQRAGHTANMIAQGIGKEAITSHMYRPWDLGDLQGKSAAAAVPVIKEKSLPEHRDEPVPGGESFNQFVKRATSGLEILLNHVKNTGENIALMTHYRMLKLAQSWLDAGMKDFDLKTLHSDDTPTGSIMRIYPKQGGWGYQMLPDKAEGVGAPEKDQIKS